MSDAAAPSNGAGAQQAEVLQASDSDNDAAARFYVDAAQRACPEGALPLVRELLSHQARVCVRSAQRTKVQPTSSQLPSSSAQVCPRCVLRFCGVDGSVLAQPAPTDAALRRAVDAEHVEQPAPAEVTAALHVCPACWGTLQFIDETAPPDAPLVPHSRGTAPGEGAGRGMLRCASRAALAAALRCGGYDENTAFQLCVTLAPGFAVLAGAQAAALPAVRRVTSLKAALLCALSPAVTAARGAAADDALPAVVLTLNVTHAAASDEVLAATDCAPLPGGGPSSKKKRKWGQHRGNEPSEADAPVADADGVPPPPAASTAVIADDAYNSVVKRMAQLPAGELASRLPAPFQLPAAAVGVPARVTFTTLRPLCYVGGYYNKRLRGISQSLWLRDEEEVGDGSVAGSIQDVLAPHLRADEFKFIAAGREDMDVRMLGPGRPFVFEITNVRSSDLSAAAMGALAAAIGAPGRVSVRQLSLLTVAQRALLREGEAEKAKAYRALVWLSRPLTQIHAASLASLRDVVLSQRTPVRVLHRRSPLNRERVVHCLTATPLPGAPQYALLDLRCAAGTYVKEFVHGDFGRTTPSLADLLLQAEADAAGHGLERCAPLQADCLQLDVRAVEMEWV